MRPSILHSLFSEIQTLKGVGERMAALLEKATGGSRLKDLLFHFPISLRQRKIIEDIRNIRSGEYVTLPIFVEKYSGGAGRYKGGKSPLTVLCRHTSGTVSLTFFHGKQEYVQQQLPIGTQRYISGRAEYFRHNLQIAHPDYMVAPEQAKTIPVVEPVYALTSGLTQKFVHKTIRQALAVIPSLPEWIKPATLRECQWQDWASSIKAIHHPRGEELSLFSPERMRLAYDELLAYQLSLYFSREFRSKKGGISIHGTGALQEALLSSLPFSLTEGQEQVRREIATDMQDNAQMLRLLQGDVGSGKTVVALLAAFHAIEAGKQVALMAPTEILARQHAAWIADVIEGAGLQDKVRTGLLVGSEKGKKRKELLESVSEGTMQLVIGTHALFQSGVSFHNLGLVIIDEQHRFGVKQRLALAEKGDRVDMLLMSATPIPRTLTLTLYGDMDISVLKEKPANRLPIDTRIISSAREKEVIEGLERTIGKGSRVYWVCPLIYSGEEESESAAVEERYKTLRKHFGSRVVLLHGQILAEEKEEAMARFSSGEVDIMVATTVIEVGVNVPEATVMVIEQAERFGLSQLHQLRGRVGRGSVASTCLLLYGQDVSETGRKRLEILRETEDGFRIAEEDLLLRGGGDLLGVKQSGFPAFLLAILPEHQALLATAHHDVKAFISQDPRLESERGTALRCLLHLFEYHVQLNYLRSG